MVESVDPKDVVIKREMCTTDVGSIYYKDNIIGLPQVSYEGYDKIEDTSNVIEINTMGVIDTLIEKVSIYYNIEKSHILICYDKNNLPVPSFKHSLLVCLNNGAGISIFKKIIVDYYNEVKAYEWKLDNNINSSFSKYLKNL